MRSAVKNMTATQMVVNAEHAEHSELQPAHSCLEDRSRLREELDHLINAAKRIRGMVG